MAYVEKKGVDLGKAQAKAVDVNSPGAATSDDEAHRRLQNANGAEFDREFITVMLGEHEKAIDLVKSARQSVTDRQLRSLLGSIEPKLEQHLKMARDIAGKQSKS
jgi:putative membrane protein